MDNTELKAYTSKIKEIELALYTENQLKQKHISYINSNIPKSPQKKNISIPNMPQKVDFIQPHVNRSSWTFLFVCFMTLMFLFWAVILIPLMISERGISALFDFFFPNLFFCVVGLGCFLYFQDSRDTKKKEKENDAKGMLLYEKALDEYNSKMEVYYNQIDEEEQKYSSELVEYNDVILPKYKKIIDEIDENHNSVYLKLKKSLDILYSENIIYPKYRNLIAISAINEYLMSGRCYELEGPNGAYNLYEMELRQNLIINKLSDIVSDLNRIKTNQYSLYESLTRSNETIASIMYEIKTLNKSSKLIEYYSKITALAESAPKVIVGYTKSIN